MKEPNYSPGDSIKIRTLPSSKYRAHYSVYITEVAPDGVRGPYSVGGTAITFPDGFFPYNQFVFPHDDQERIEAIDALCELVAVHSAGEHFDLSPAEEAVWEKAKVITSKYVTLTPALALQSSN